MNNREVLSDRLVPGLAAVFEGTVAGITSAMRWLSRKFDQHVNRVLRTQFLAEQCADGIAECPKIVGVLLSDQAIGGVSRELHVEQEEWNRFLHNN
ncbi:MAG: hypothetical protein C7B47_14395 [Sulfobacillus thermosulfidooxidans]|uniref:Uncharacterized protein n=1 Tax=Sulfobacillus thermosulfidooxidans TaxID=28034 RepID=A0A2T2WQW0_SULTH|nr:MAG: hypothetical protein C7B47_14395 [Sulfobacillus thermosulfidooxidans]